MTMQLENATANAIEWTLDPAHTLVEFSTKHMMITTVRGRFREVEGTLHLDRDDLGRSSVSVRMDATTLDTGIKARDEHLRSADFLEVEAYPVVTYESKSVEGSFTNPGDRFRVIGDLTIRGTTREVVLDATYEGEGADPWGGTRVSFSAEARIDRRDFGLTWNQGLEAGGILVGNEVRISLQAQATLTA